MVKQLRRTRMQKKFNYQRNRKRVQKNLNNKGTIKETLIKNEWQKGKSITNNLDDMGLVFDANKNLGLPNSRNDRKKVVKLVNGFYEEDTESQQLDESAESTTKKIRTKQHVADTMEKDANTLVESRFRLSKGIVKEVTAYIDKYGLDYKAMARDSMNYYQDTWRQIRAKVRKFLSIPQQCTEYLAEKGFLDGELDENDPRWKEAETDDD